MQQNQNLHTKLLCELTVFIFRGGDSLADTIKGGGLLSRSEFRSKPITTAGNCIQSVEIFFGKTWMFIAVFKN